MFKFLLKFFSNINYSHPDNRKMFENQYEKMSENLKFTSNVFIDNILGNRNNLLILVWWLVAFIWIINWKLDWKTDIYLKITVISFVLTIFFATLVAIVWTVFDIKLLRYNLKIQKEYLIQVSEFLGKVKKIKFDKSEAEKYESIRLKYLEDIKTPLRFKISEWIFWLCTNLYSLGLIVWMVSMTIFYIKIIL
jgi:hypothetical protein